VTSLAGGAAGLAQGPAPQAAQTLGQAVQTSGAAVQAAGLGDFQGAAAAQGATAGLLATAAGQLDQAAAGLAAQGQQIAGDLAGAMAMGQGTGQGMGQGTPQQGGQPGLPSPIIGSGGVSQGGPWVQNQPPAEQPLQAAPPRFPFGAPTPEVPQQVQVAERAFEANPWFAKLPPELRSAIRNNSQRRAPRGYEKRLQEYFENID